MGNTIVTHNKKGDTKINFVGLAVGDPVMNGKYQYKTYADTLYGMGLVSEDEREQVRNIMFNAIENLDSDCPTAFKYWNSVWNDNNGGGSPGLFWKFTGSSATMHQALTEGNESFNASTKWLLEKDVIRALHIEGIPTPSFDEGGAVYETMVNSGDFCADSTHL